MNQLEGGKNISYEQANQLFVLLNNKSPEEYVTASSQDWPTIRDHRWRLIGSDVVTTMQSGSIEVKTTLDSVLFGVSRKKVIRKKNGNPLDYRRENISFTEKETNQIISIDDVSSYLMCKNAPPIVVDSEDTERLERFYWNCIKIKGESTVLTVYREDGKSRRRQLARFILGLSITDSRVIVFANGDKFDCRKQNLLLRKRNGND